MQHIQEGPAHRGDGDDGAGVDQLGSDRPGNNAAASITQESVDIGRSNSLTDLATRIRAEHDAAGAAIKRGVEHAIAAGALLLEAKERLGHGEWLPWLREHCGISARSAQRYMRIAKNQEELKANATPLSDLTLTEALKILEAKTDLERALEADARWEAIRAELKMLDAQLDSADFTGLKYIINRANELAGEIVEMRMRAQMELGRLARELEQAEKQMTEVAR